MKKIITAILAAALLFCLVGCGSKPADSSSAAASGSAGTAASSAQSTQSGSSNPVQDVFSARTSSATGAYATVVIQPEIELMENAWIGLCPAGEDYLNERAADDVDVWWTDADAREDGDPYVFACDFESVEDGTYAVVVATSDDEDVGYIVIQLEMTKKGDSVSFDFSNAKLNKAPAK